MIHIEITLQMESTLETLRQQAAVIHHKVLKVCNRYQLIAKDIPEKKKTRKDLLFLE